jgi:demethylmacrocin O-methyltransferase
MKTLKEFADEYSQLDKSCIGYISLYEFLFNPIRTKVKKVLEIGIQSGKSLRLWRDFFPNAKIYGWDIDSASLIQEDRIFSDIVNHDDKQQVLMALEKMGKNIDIIIDDGSHFMNSQQRLVPWCLPYVASGGLYITEDIGTSFPAKGGNYGLRKDGGNSTYKILNNFLYSGKYESEYASEEEKKYVNDNVKSTLMYSTIRKYPDYFSSLRIEDWPTFPIFVFIKK